MVTGHPPFRKADGRDFWYQNFFVKNFENFWTLHDRQRMA